MPNANESCSSWIGTHEFRDGSALAWDFRFQSVQINIFYENTTVLHDHKITNAESWRDASVESGSTKRASAVLHPSNFPCTVNAGLLLSINIPVPLMCRPIVELITCRIIKSNTWLVFCCIGNGIHWMKRVCSEFYAMDLSFDLRLSLSLSEGMNWAPVSCILPLFRREGEGNWVTTSMHVRNVIVSLPLEKRREVVLELQVDQVRHDLWFTPPRHGCHLPLAINQPKSPPFNVPPLHEMCHSPCRGEWWMGATKYFVAKSLVLLFVRNITNHLFPGKMGEKCVNLGKSKGSSLVLLNSSPNS